MAGKKNYELEIMISGGTDSSLASSIKKARKEIDSLQKSAGLSAKDINDAFGGMSIKGIDALGGMSDKVFGAMIKGGAAAAAGLAAGLTAATNVGMGFESQMKTVQAISQASEEDMRKLTDLAKEMGETTQFSAEEAGKGLEYMAMAGWKTQDMIGGLPGIMYLAAASGEDLGSVSDIVTDAMTAFGMQANEAGHFADVLAQASASSNTNVSMMGETFQYVAPVAGAYGYIIEDVAIATGLMANAGIKGQKAGTAMRTMLTNLAKPTKQMRGYMDALKISLTDGSGEMKSFRVLLGEMRTAFAGLTEAEKAEYAAGIAGKEGMSGLLAMVTASDEDFVKLTQAIDNSTGAAQKMSEIRLDNLTGDLTLLGSAAQGLGIEAYEGFSDVLRGLAQEGTGWVTQITERLKEDMPTIRRQAKQFGEDVKEGFRPVLEFGEWSLEHPEVIKGTLTGITAAFGTFKAVQAAKNGVALFGKLSGMISAWPVAAAGLAIGGIVGIGTAIQSAHKQAARADLAEHFGDITLSIEELDEAARHIVSGGGNLFENIDLFGEASDKALEFKTSMDQAMKELKKSGWKLSMGIEFDADDTQSYVSGVESYVKNAQEYITSSGYELKLAVGIVYGENDPTGIKMAGDSDAFYQSLYQQLQPLEESLNEVLADITENGLTLPKQQIVDGYLGEISEITSMITEAENAAKMQILQDKYAGAALTGDTFQNLQQSIQEYTNEANAGIDESYQKILTSLYAQRLAGEKGMEGGISQTEFDTKSNDALQAYYDQKAQTIQNGYELMYNTIMSTYGDELGPALEAVSQQIQDGLPQIMEGNAVAEDYMNAFYRLLLDTDNAAGLSREARDAVKLLVENMTPTQEDLEQLKLQMEASGLEPSAIIEEAFGEMTSVKAVLGDEDSIWKMIGDEIANNEDYALLTATIEQQTGMIPDVAIAAIEEKNEDVREAAQDILKTIADTFAEGVQVNVPITLDTVTQYRSGVYGGTQRIEHHASGGLMEKPTLSWFAEESPEMAIPIDGSNRAMSLWQETGRLLGAYDFTGMTQELTEGAARNSTFAPVFSPVIQVQGGGSAESQFAAGMDEAYERFVDFMERFQKEQYRPAF